MSIEWEPAPRAATSTDMAAAIVVPTTAPRQLVTGSPVATSAHAAPPSAAGAVGGTVLALVLVVGLILTLAWLARRMPGLAGTGDGALRVVGSLSLGPRERVVVVEVGGTQLLLGVGSGGTRTLHTLTEPLPAPPPARTPPFAQLLAQHLRRKP